MSERFQCSSASVSVAEKDKTAAPTESTQEIGCVLIFSQGRPESRPVQIQDEVGTSGNVSAVGGPFIKSAPALEALARTNVWSVRGRGTAFTWPKAFLPRKSVSHCKPAQPSRGSSTTCALPQRSCALTFRSKGAPTAWAAALHPVYFPFRGPTCWRPLSSTLGLRGKLS